MPDRSPPRPSLGRRTSACPGEGREPAEIILADPAWRRAVPYLQRRVTRAIATGGGAGTVLLSSDRAVRALNRQHRGIDKPTNVLTFDPAYPGAGGDIVLAYGVMRREARAAGRTLAAHLAHLLIHGALHLQGEDHHGVGEARRMEMLEARLLHRLHIPNPWKPAIVRPT